MVSIIFWGPTTCSSAATNSSAKPGYDYQSDYAHIVPAGRRGDGSFIFAI